ncbi:hypothetical protein ACWD5Q_32210 [Streptomyces sp. NPDC002513]
MRHTHATYVRNAGRRRLLSSPVSAACGEQPSRETGNRAERERPADTQMPTDTQVWNWAESAVLFGYGPGPASFL